MKKVRWMVVVTAFCVLMYSGSLFAGNNGIGALAVPFEFSISDVATETVAFGAEFMPTTYHNGKIYSVRVQAIDSIVANTIITEYSLDGSGGWVISASHIIENQTRNESHNTASIAVDTDGYIHVAYNHHNTQWQYVVSAQPGDITSWEFRGVELTPEQMAAKLASGEASGTFVDGASILGTQITYPSFYTDNNGVLYITYRQATKPKLPWPDRDFAGSLAKYDTATKTWTGLGGDIVVSSAEADFSGGGATTTLKALAFSTTDTPIGSGRHSRAWSIYLMNLAFDTQNNMHIAWTWRDGGAGPKVSHPSYASSDDGGLTFKNSSGTTYTLPISIQDVEIFRTDGEEELFRNWTKIDTDLFDKPHILSSHDNVFGTSLSTTTSTGWETELLPSNGPAIFIDEDGRFWNIATGPKIYTRENSTSSWELIHTSAGDSYGFTRVHKIPGERRFILRTADSAIATAKIQIVSYAADPQVI